MNRRIDFLSGLSVIPGFGDKRIKALNDSHVKNVSDLLHHLPRSYITHPSAVKSNHSDQSKDSPVTLYGAVTESYTDTDNSLHIILKDNSGIVELICYTPPKDISTITEAGVYLKVTGIPSIESGRYIIVHPGIEIYSGNESKTLPYEPRYSMSDSMRSAGITQQHIISALIWLFNNITHFPEKLPELLEKRYEFPSLEESLRHLHFPRNPHHNLHWVRRIRYERMYKTALNLRWIRRIFQLPGTAMHGEELRSEFLSLLHLNLTEEQFKAVITLAKDSSAPHRMHRLLQADINCDKTIIAFMATLPALQSGFQVAWISPTKSSAVQSFKTIKPWLKLLGFTPVLLTESTPLKEKRGILYNLKIGSLPFVIGTEALLQNHVGFNSLRMVVMDMQHSLNTGQCLTLLQKSAFSDLLIIANTPIPQLLAKTIFHDLNLLTIHSDSEGRKAVKTHFVTEQKRHDMEQFIIQRITDSGEQIFWVVPPTESHINECMDEHFHGLKNIEKRFQQLSQGAFHKTQLDLIHSDMSDIKIEQAISAFTSGKTSILLNSGETKTNIPKTSIAVIENCEYFGLSELYQLQERIESGAGEAWIFLMADSLTDNEITQLKYLSGKHNAFEIAELDLQQQIRRCKTRSLQSEFSGLPNYNVYDDAEMFQQAVNDINSTLTLED